MTVDILITILFPILIWLAGFVSGKIVQKTKTIKHLTLEVQQLKVGDGAADQLDLIWRIYKTLE